MSYRTRYAFPLRGGAETKEEEEPKPVDAKQYLNDLADELHKPVKRKFDTRHVFAAKKDWTWGMDLADMNTWKDDNDDYRYILLVIDVFTRWGEGRPLRTKSGTEVLAALKDICAEHKRIPHSLWVDEGTEFKNKEMTAWRDEHGIIMYHTYGNGKSVVAERFVRTIKTKLFKELTKQNSYKWVHLLPGLIAQYNDTVHGTLHMTPNQASADPKAAEGVWDRLKKKYKKSAVAKFAVGDIVRFSRSKGVFEKGYDVSWSRERFTVTSVDTSKYPVVYRLKDMKGEEIKGSFYAEELQKVKHGDVDLIEEVLDEKGKGKNKMILVKFLGYPKSFNRWIPYSSTVSVK